MKQIANVKKFVVIQVILLWFILSIPLYLYLNSSLENNNLQNRLLLQNHGKSVSQNLSLLSDEKKFLDFLKESTINTLIYDTNNELLFSFNILNKEKLCIKYDLHQNSFGASYLKLCKDSSNLTLFFNVGAIFIGLCLVVFVFSFMIIRRITEPFRELNDHLDDFLKDAMHELKTPIGVAWFNVDMLSMRIKEDKYLLRIRYALKNMTIIYEDLEYYIKRNTQEDEKDSIAFSLFLQKRCEFFKDLSDAKNITLEIDIQENICLEFNEIELYRIVDNTLSNAIKYSKNDTKMTITLIQKENDISFKVKDQGVGIEDSKKIFYRYYRGDKITGGFGIGLSIVKQICDKNSINIKVDSKVNEGSIFTYRFKS